MQIFVALCLLHRLLRLISSNPPQIAGFSTPSSDRQRYYVASYGQTVGSEDPGEEAGFLRLSPLLVVNMPKLLYKRTMEKTETLEYQCDEHRVYLIVYHLI